MGDRKGREAGEMSGPVGKAPAREPQRVRATRGWPIRYAVGGQGGQLDAGPAQRGPGAEVPLRLKNSFEALSGHAFGDVRIHYSSAEPARYGADAVARQNQVFLGPGQEGLLPHELGHIAQQKQGRVTPTGRRDGLAVNESPALEREAQRLGEEALREEDTQREGAGTLSPGSVSHVAQLAHKNHVKFWEGIEVPLEAEAHAEAEQEAEGEHEAEAGHEAPPPLPLMVFETFGNDADQLLGIFNQSLQYHGRTLCILGLNQRMTGAQVRPNEPDFNAAAGAPDLGQAALAAQIHATAAHRAIIVPFYWTPTDLVGGYDLPYFEVRSRLMLLAINKTEEEENVLYRWIDRDAQNDTTHEIPGNILREAAELTGPHYLTGAYSWGKENVDLPADQWEGFEGLVDRLNDAERELRNFWFNLNRRFNLNSRKFYLPEPTLLMNSLAHSAARARLILSQNEDNGQQKESKVALGDVNSTTIQFLTQLKVEKPNKIIPGGGGEQTYLHHLVEYFQGVHNPENLAVALKNTRQSAFNNSHWAFCISNDWNNWQTETPAQHAIIAPYLRDVVRDGVAMKIVNMAQINQLDVDKRKEAAQCLLNQQRRKLAASLL